MKYNKINNLTGWLVMSIAAVVYLLTMERTASFWDCGEFIASCFKLQVPHPPGAPLFVLLGRFFILLFGAQPGSAALAVSTMSALASAFTILFLFWTITNFAARLVRKNTEPLSGNQVFSIMSAGVVGALAYTFSDSFWFSAVEGEVYALSSLFTAIVFWSILKWEARAQEKGSDRWIVLIFFLMGLSIGVHLLNLLAIPAIIMVYYFKRYTPSRKGIILAFIAGCTITGIIQKFLIQSTIQGAGNMDIWFVNSLGLPFFSGFAFYFILLATALTLAIRYANRKRYPTLKLALWSVAFLLLGYSTYLTTMIRSNADPAIDMFNVDNPVSLAGYLGREQYNDWPIVYGPDFTERAPRKETGIKYAKNEKSYAEVGKNSQPDWVKAPGAHLFPRMWDAENDRNQLECYQNFSGVESGENPTMAHNVKYFTNYQAGWMYFRYFMWNFAGRQNDIQGFGNTADSNWVSGINFVDNIRLGDQKNLPDSIHTDNKAYNRLFLLPFILGLAGFLYQYKRKKPDWIVNTLLFFFTGLAIVIYLNQSGYQPRERDYAYVGSFYAFAIWIGLGVLAVIHGMQRLWKSKLSPYAAAAICLLAVPMLMASQEWDDHDRSQKTLARDLARNFLESCPKDAILFTAEDNDTYALWYLQEVEGIRKDVRVMVNTILATDWYINQLRYKINESDPVDVLFTKDQISGSRRDVLFFVDQPGFDANQYYDLKSVLKNVAASDDPQFTRQTEDGESINILPTRKFTVPVDEQYLRKQGIIRSGEQVVPVLKVEMPDKQYLIKNELAILAILSTNQWKRPICFTSTRDLESMGLAKYCRQEGLIHRLVPVENAGLDTEKSFDLLKRFTYGGAEQKDQYFDEENRRRFGYLELAHAQVALALAAEGKKEKAREILQQFDQHLKTSSFTYGLCSSRGNQHNMISLEFLKACLAAEDQTLATKVKTALEKDLRQQLSYYQQLNPDQMSTDQLANEAYQLLQGKGSNLSNRQSAFAYDIFSAYQLLRQLGNT